MIFSGTATTILPDYYAAVALVTGSGTTYAVSERSASDPNVFNYSETNFSGSFDFSTGVYWFDLEVAGSGTSIFFVYTETSTEVVRAEPDYSLKTDGNIAYLARPEDETGTDYVDEVADEYPWVRGLVGGGELVELDTYVTSRPDVAIDVVGEATGVQAHTGVDVEIVGIPSPTTGILRLMPQDLPTDSAYKPSHLAIGYSGTFKDLSTLSATELQFINSENDFETLFEAGYGIYHVGLAQGVLVADLPKFFGPQHRDGMVGWMPFNEHPEDALNVLDHSSIQSTAVLANISDVDRVWSSERGWFLNLPANGSVAFDGYRGIVDEQTVSFWMNPSAVSGNGTTTIVTCGPLSFDYDNAGNYVFAYTGSAATRQLIGSGTVFAEQWQFFYAKKDSTSATFGSGDLSTAVSQTSIAALGEFTAGTENDTLTLVQAGSRAFGIHDLRIWDQAKSQADVDLIRYHDPSTTITNYRLGSISTVSKRDRYGFRVLPSGFVTSDELPAWVRSVRMGRVRRYDSAGEYTGESRFKQVGLGGGAPLPSTFQLGAQFTALAGDGTTVYSTSFGMLPGENAIWLNDSFGGTYAVITSASGSSSTTGASATYTTTGTGSPFPNDQKQINPVRDEIWVVGDDGYVYEVTLVGSLTSTGFATNRITRQRSDAELKVNSVLQVITTTTGSVYTYTAQGTIYSGQLSVTASTGSIISIGTTASTGAVTVLTNGSAVIEVLHPSNLRDAEQPTGAEVILAGTGSIASINASGSFYQKTWSGTLTTPPLYMYLNERIVADAPNAWDFWTDNTKATNFGNQQNPPVAALSDNGELEFEHNGTLLAGRYEMDVTSANIGNPDADFRGFNVEITVNSTTFAATLLKGKTGYDVEGTDTLSFTTDDSVIGDWLLSFKWTNAYADESTGRARQLSILSYQLRRLGTELYRVDIATSGTTPTLTELSVT